MQSEAITETALATQTGVPRTKLKAYRLAQLDRGIDWRLEARKVIYTAAGRVLLSRHIGIGDFQKIEKKAPETAAHADFVKVRNCPRNKRIVLAVPLNAADRRAADLPPGQYFPITGDDQNASPVRVQVRDNSRFVPGMPLPVRHVQADLYELSCNQPRYRGRF